MPAIEQSSPLTAISPAAPMPAPLILPPDLMAALRHEDANAANWEGVFPDAFNGFDDLTDEGGLK